MRRVSEPAQSPAPSLGQRAAAVLVLLVAAWVLLHFLVHIALAFAALMVVVLAIVALVWALRVVL